MVSAIRIIRWLRRCRALPCAGLLLLGGGWLVAADAGPGAAAVPNSDCMDCHEAEPPPKSKGGPAKVTGVRPEFFQKSVHGKLNCVDCHTSITETPTPRSCRPPSALHATPGRSSSTPRASTG